MSIYIHQCPDCGIVHENIFRLMERCERCRPMQGNKTPAQGVIGV